MMTQAHNGNKRLYLASRSPRRAQLLQQVGVEFALLSTAVDEQPLSGEHPEIYVSRLAKLKAIAGWNKVLAENLTRMPVLGADTTVVLNNKIMGKPINKDHGLAMLESLSGKTHQVMTSVCLYYQCGESGASVEIKNDIVLLRTNVTEVTFRKLSHQQIEQYWATGEPEGKAGSYAIQGFAAVFVDQLQGSYSSVVGLPLSETYQMLEKIEKTIMALSSQAL